MKATLIKDCLPSQLNAFELSFALHWEELAVENTNRATYSCESDQFYLAIPNIVRFLAIPKENRVIIERAHSAITLNQINTWLLGTVMAYMLQYHNYLVLHGSAVLRKGKALIFSGQSGAGKSTLACALTKKGYPFITDDLVVVKHQCTGDPYIYCGPSQVKLCQDSMTYFDYDPEYATPTHHSISKYVIPVEETQTSRTFPIDAMYEINIAPGSTHNIQKLNGSQALKTLMENAYRYFMLEPLNKLGTFFDGCCLLSRQISINKLIRTTDFNTLQYILRDIEQDRELSHEL